MAGRNGKALRLDGRNRFTARAPQLDALTIDRDQFLQEMRDGGVSCSVHWRPLHLHPYYQDTFDWTADSLPVASAQWVRLVSLPLFSAMRRDEIDAVVATVRTVCSRATRLKRGLTPV